MSNSITISLTTKRREDAEKIAARAAELVKEKNCDLEFELFDADDGSCSGIGIAELYGEACGIVQRIIEGVVTSFPDIEMREQVSANGELYKEYVSENGKLVEVEIVDEEEARIMALRSCLAKLVRETGAVKTTSSKPCSGVSISNNASACCSLRMNNGCVRLPRRMTLEPLRCYWWVWKTATAHGTRSSLMKILVN